MTAPLISTVFDPPLPTDPKATFNLKAFSLVAGLNGWSTQANAQAEYLDALAASVEVFDALVGFRGAWSVLTGALAMPASVSHTGNIYALTADVADVTAHTPGVSASWQLVRATSEQITHGAGTVASKFVSVDAEAADIRALTAGIDNSNLFANSAFLINVRGYVSGAATSGANQYTLDRLRVVVSGESISWVAGTFGNRITAPAGGAEQVIEGLFITGGSYACTWTGTGTITVNGTARAKGESFALTAGVDVTVRLVGEFEAFKFGRPGMLDRYEYSPEADGRICRRYARLNSGSAGLATAAGVVSGVMVSFDQPMRADPSATLVNGTSKLHDPAVAFRTITAINTNGVKFDGGYLDMASSGMTSGRFHLLLPGAVLFTSEL